MGSGVGWGFLRNSQNKSLQLIPDPFGRDNNLADGSGIRNNEKNQRSAELLYIAPGFAHIGS